MAFRLVLCEGVQSACPSGELAEGQWDRTRLGTSPACSARGVGGNASTLERPTALRNGERLESHPATSLVRLLRQVERGGRGDGR
jgi:hypothetical protein